MINNVSGLCAAPSFQAVVANKSEVDTNLPSLALEGLGAYRTKDGIEYGRPDEYVFIKARASQEEDESFAGGLKGMGIPSAEFVANNRLSVK